MLEARGLMHEEIKNFVQGYTVNDETGSVTKLHGLKASTSKSKIFTKCILENAFYQTCIHKGDYNSPWEEFK